MIRPAEDVRVHLCREPEQLAALRGQVHGVAVGVGKDLGLDMPWRGQVALEDHALVAEGSGSFAPCGLERLGAVVELHGAGKQAPDGVDRIIVSSLIGHALDCLETGLPTLEVLHDGYPAWPLLDIDPGGYGGDEPSYSSGAGAGGYGGGDAGGGYGGDMETPF